MNKIKKMNNQLLVNEFEATMKASLQRQNLNIKLGEIRMQENNFDASIEINGHKVLVEIKRAVDPLMANQIIHQSHQITNGLPSLLFASYITPKAKSMLVEAGINYLDGGGNLYLKLPQLSVRDEGHKVAPHTAQYRNRAFAKTGAAVVFQLLMDSNAINDTQRSLAKKAKVSLGSVPLILEELTQAGFVIQLDRHTKKLNNQEKLLLKWADSVYEKILPSHLVGRFVCVGKTALELLRENPFDTSTQWGGEPAAALLTHYLRPQEFTLYTEFHPKALARKYKLVPSDKGEIAVYQKFWNHMDGKNTYVHPTLIYAQLITSGDDRNIDTAKIILDEYIRPNL
ncbi:MAG: hypothetical protein KDC83_04290 [Flavobacteriales bacterium]|nr:hypothetical protein [Flavobacteriales bacterium]